MDPKIEDAHGLITKEQMSRLRVEIRNASRLRLPNMTDKDFDALVAVLEFIGMKPNGVALSGEIISFLDAKPHCISRSRISDLLKYLTSNNFISLGGTVNRWHPLGNLHIQLNSMRGPHKTAIQ